MRNSFVFSFFVYFEAKEQVGQLAKLTRRPVLIAAHLRWPRKRRSAALRARIALIFFCWKAKLSKDFRFAFWYLNATDEILYTTSEVEDPRKNTNI